MKGSAMVGMAACMALTAGVCCAEQLDKELLSNGGFENTNISNVVEYVKQWQAGFWWTNMEAYPVKAEVIQEAQYAHSGNHCLSVSPIAKEKSYESGILCQGGFPVEKGEVYETQFWAKGHGQLSVGFGGFTVDNKYLYSGHVLKDQELTSHWKKYTVSIEVDKLPQLLKVIGVFYFIAPKEGNLVLDDCSFKRTR